MPPTFESGVKSYIVGTCQIEVNFPVNWKGEPDVRCEQCDYYSRTGHICQINKRIVEYPEKFIGSQCPLNFNEEEQT